MLDDNKAQFIEAAVETFVGEKLGDALRDSDGLIILAVGGL